jgi:hypothetical protein
MIEQQAIEQIDEKKLTDVKPSPMDLLLLDVLEEIVFNPETKKAAGDTTASE